ncbi:MAG: hypothetical protein R3299_00160 [Arenibacter sp.]|nr:hypothetical protein [Arenibacter sp.]
MSNSMILISVLLVLAVVVPLIVLNISGKGETKTVIHKTKEYAKEAQLKFNTKESWGNRFIAIDKNRNVLVFSRMVNGEVMIRKIALEKVEKVEVQMETKTVKVNAVKEKLLQKMELAIGCYDQPDNPLVLNFYELGQIYTEDYEQRRAEKWKAIINEAAKNNEMVKKVA